VKRPLDVMCVTKRLRKYAATKHTQNTAGSTGNFIKPTISFVRLYIFLGV